MTSRVSSDYDLPPLAPKGGTFAGVACLANSIIGTGMLTLAYGLSRCGWALGISWFIVCAVLSGFTAHLLNCIAVAMPEKRLTYNTVSVHAGLPWLAPVTDVVLFVNNALMDTVYLQVFADIGLSLTEHFSPGSTQTNRFWIRAGFIGLVIVLLLPICMAKHISANALTSAIGLTLFLYSVIAGVSYAAATEEVAGTDSVGFPPESDIWQMLSVMPLFVGAYSCHFVVLPVAQDTTNRNMRKLDVILFLAFVVVTVFFVVAMVIPYYVYGYEVTSNFYLSLPLGHPAILTGYITLPIALLTAFPIILFAARQSLGEALCYFWPSLKDTNKLHIGSTLLFIIFCLSISLGVEDLGYTYSFMSIVTANT
ncbi:hypothetical protein FOZ63_001896, partial [Perkinsus olseni]